MTQPLMPPTDQIQQLVALLHSRGIEATPDDIYDFLTHVAYVYWKTRHKHINKRDFLQDCLDDKVYATMVLHSHFGDAL